MKWKTKKTMYVGFRIPKIWWILEHFIKHKPLISEEWYQSGKNSISVNTKVNTQIWVWETNKTATKSGCVCLKNWTRWHVKSKPLWILHSEPENLKKSWLKKNSWNQINQFHNFFFIFSICWKFREIRILKNSQ